MLAWQEQRWREKPCYLDLTVNDMPTAAFFRFIGVIMEVLG
jgi:hypothetical protein